MAHDYLALSLKVKSQFDNIIWFSYKSPRIRVDWIGLEKNVNLYARKQYTSNSFRERSSVTNDTLSALRQIMSESNFMLSLKNVA